MRIRSLLARALPLVVVAVATFACFAPTLGHDLLRHHDADVVTAARTRALGPGALMTLAVDPTSDAAPPPAYHPLTALSFALDARAWQTDPSGWHLTSVLLHVLNALLAYLLIVRLLAGRGQPSSTVTAAAAVAALAWALHPLRAEAVAWVSARATLLSTAGMLAAALAHLRAAAVGPDDPPATEWRAASVAFAGLAMAASAAAVVLPLVLLVVDAHPLHRLRRATAARVVAEKLPSVALAAVVVWLAASGEPAVTVTVPPAVAEAPAPSATTTATPASQRAPATGMTTAATNGPTPAAGAGFAARLGAAAVTLVVPLWKTLAPLGLSPLYASEPRTPLPLACAVAVLALTVGLVAAARRWPAGLAAWTAYVVLMLPYLAVPNAALAADRWSHAATLPIAALVAGGLALGAQRVRGRRPRIAAGAAVATALALLAWLGARQAGIWRSPRALWTTAAARTPESLAAHLAAGRALRDDGEVALAVPHWDAALALAGARALPPAERGAIERELARGLARLGHTALYEHEPARAVDHFERARRLAPDDHRLRLDLAAVYLQLGRTDAATAELEQALAVDPADERTLNAMAVALIDAQRLDDAETRLRQALAVAPENAVTRTNLGAVLQKLGRLDEAIHEWEEALRIDPDLAAARKNLDQWHDTPDDAGPSP